MFTSEYCAFKILTHFDFFYLRGAECFSSILRLSTSFLWRFAIVKTVAWRCCVIYLRPAKLFEKRLWHRCVPVNFAKFLRTDFIYNTSEGCFFIVALCEKCSNREFFLVRIFPYSVQMRGDTDQEKRRIHALWVFLSGNTFICVSIKILRITLYNKQELVQNLTCTNTQIKSNS